MTKRFLAAALLTVGVSLSSIAPRHVLAQETQETQETEADDGFQVKSPVFLFMPSVITANAISAPNGLDAVHGFNVRFQTTIPTSTPWFTPVFGVQWLPNGLDGNDQNSPIIFYGFVFPIILPEWTGGWLGVSIDPLGVYALGNGGRQASQPYGHDFFLELAVTVPIGAKMMRQMGQFSNLAAFFLVDQQITHPPRDADGDRDYWRPVLIYGLALPLAPWGR
ncbi:MAG TPA: hypothetical protein VJ812_07545 [Gemmatimonadaceae bacterium]|jgi:hypothetical protein|nr:hypothetical protein [Gemmatimonadaceae bacterium]